jgi:hypothetical protein
LCLDRAAMKNRRPSSRLNAVALCALEWRLQARLQLSWE